MDARRNGTLVVTGAWIEELARPTFRERDEGAERARQLREATRAFEDLLPPLYRWARLESPLLLQRVKLAIPTELPTSTSVVFLGAPGIGKTSLAIAMLRATLERELDASNIDRGDTVAIARKYRFAHAHRLDAARLGGPAGLSEIESATRAPILLLDDLGEGAKIPSTAVPDVVQERHAESRPTWFTTSLTPKEIAERYGGGIARRVFEHAHVVRQSQLSTASLRPLE